jgi:chorismate mutase
MTKPLTIPEIRQTIDEADDILLKALAARFRAVHVLKEIKKATGVQVESPSREAELKARWKKKAQELDLTPELALLILDFLLMESKRIQNA